MIWSRMQADAAPALEPLRFELTVRRLPDVLALAIRGELTDAEAYRLRDKLSILLAWRRDQTVCDLEGLVFLSCRAMAALIDYCNEVKRRGGTILLQNARPEIRDAFLLVGMHYLFAVEPVAHFPRVASRK